MGLKIEEIIIKRDVWNNRFNNYATILRLKIYSFDDYIVLFSLLWISSDLM